MGFSARSTFCASDLFCNGGKNPRRLQLISHKPKFHSGVIYQIVEMSESWGLVFLAPLSQQSMGPNRTTLDGGGFFFFFFFFALTRQQINAFAATIYISKSDSSITQF